MFPDRIKRVEELVKNEVALILQHEMKDPRLGWATVQSAKVSRDLRNARLYVSILDDGETDPKDVIKTLNSAAGFIRKTLGDRVDLKYLPELRFYLDDTPYHAQHMDDLYKQVQSQTSETSHNDEVESP